MSEQITDITYVNIDKLEEENKSEKILISVLEIKNKVPEILDQFWTAYNEPSNIPVVLINFFYKYGLDNYGQPFELKNFLIRTHDPFVSRRGHENYQMYYNFRHKTKITFHIKIYFSGIEKGELVKDQLDKVNEIYR